MSEGLVDRVARAIAGAYDDPSIDPEEWEEEARAAIRAVADHLVVDGMTAELKYADAGKVLEAIALDLTPGRGVRVMADDVLEKIAQKMAVGLWEKCRCHEGFKDRGRVDPSCHFCAVGPEDAQISGLAWAEALEEDKEAPVLELARFTDGRAYARGWAACIARLRSICGVESK